MAKFRRYQTKLTERADDWPLKLHRFEFERIPSLGSGEFGFSGPLTVLCGPNGVGKTTLLRAIWATASPSTYVRTPGTDLKLLAGRGLLEYHWDTEKRRAEQVFGANSDEEPEVPEAGEEDEESEDGETSPRPTFPVTVIHIDSAGRAARYQNAFCEIGNFEEITNGVAPLSLNQSDVEHINSLCSRSYRSVSVYEVEIADGLYAPFFEVTYQDDHYDSRTMGTGEAAAMYLWWEVNQAKPNSLLLIEEPESFLSPKSQKAFVNFLTVLAVQKHYVVVVTSHSPKIIETVSDEHRSFIHRDRGNAVVDTGGASPELLGTIGIEQRVDNLILVEDNAAKTFANAILRRYRPELFRRSEIIVMNGHGDITACLKRLGGKPTDLSIVGLYDGDQKGSVETDVEPFSAFLPGDIPIEQVFRKLVEDDPNNVQVALGVERLSEINFALEGEEAHDWFEEFAKALGVDKGMLFQQLFSIWERQDGSPETCLSCVGEIEAVIFPAEPQSESDAHVKNKGLATEKVRIADMPVTVETEPVIDETEVQAEDKPNNK
ncbi:ATP-dependent nuclease [Erythrobacter litoralis]|uniref:ATP-dependent nuclease n=1 Tax=Erythrobacter litoralis TaxID=39960 RepID=UPI002434E614|nr:AAA family ATPase [Erythrobacter litoralis]